MLLFRSLARSPFPRLSAFRDHFALAKLILVMLVSAMLLPDLALAQPWVSVVLTEPRSYYQQAADSLTRALSREGWKVTVSTPASYVPNGSDLTVAIGTPALEKVLATGRRPVLSLLVPRSTYERLASGRPQVSALYLDQPLYRQLQLLQLALPDLKNVGAPLGPVSRELQDALQAVGRGNETRVHTAIIEKNSDLYPALTGLAAESEAFLLLPDPLVAHRSSLQNFFLHTYRLKRPVLAYSAPLAKSGAIMALYTTPEQAGEEAADWIRDSWSGNSVSLGGPRYPKRFTISINSTVARSLDITLPSVDVLTRKLEALQ
jgi:ABC-type uncharacterized transport system substrate-binding protein